MQQHQQAKNVPALTILATDGHQCRIQKHQQQRKIWKRKRKRIQQWKGYIYNYVYNQGRGRTTTTIPLDEVIRFKGQGKGKHGYHQNNGKYTPAKSSLAYWGLIQRKLREWFHTGVWRFRAFRKWLKGWDSKKSTWNNKIMSNDHA